jgi:hypothetical protein
MEMGVLVPWDRRHRLGSRERVTETSSVTRHIVMKENSENY